MKEKITLEGRSLIVNIGFIVLNLLGLTFLVIGYHDNFEDNATLFKSMGWILMMLSIGGLIIFKGRLLMASTSRVFVGGLFIVSGLVKANDPIGFSYKLEEYFEDGALAYRVKELLGAPGFSMEVFIDWALFLSVLICVVEIVLGVLVIIGGKIKIVSYLMMAMMLFFTLLTWHTSTCDGDIKFVDHDTYIMSDAADAQVAETKLSEARRFYNEVKNAENANTEYEQLIWVVSKSKDEVVIGELKSPQCVDDCGCFGDAMKGSVGRSLTPKESLWKDIVLLYLVFWIFIAQWIITPNTRKENRVLIPASLIVILFFSWVFGWYFPIFFGAISIFGALWVLRNGNRYLGNYYGSSLLVVFLTLFMTTYVLMYNPIKDYRPYSIGSDLNVKMNDGVVGEYENVLVYKNLITGKEKEFNATSEAYFNSKIWEDTLNWKYKEMREKVLVEPKNASIMDFHPMINLSDLSDAERGLQMIKKFTDTSSIRVIRFRDHYDDQIYEVPIQEYYSLDYPESAYTVLDTLLSFPDAISDVDIKDALLREERIVAVISKRLDDACWDNIDKVKALFAASKKENVPFILICNASRSSINEFRTQNKFNIPTFLMDEIELKIISRSNPSIVVFEKGIVKGKYPYRSTPSVELFRSNHLK
ncbi:MAG: DoxX family membrane protein [Crocinitomicaceae bacterium]|nr:DoxX family membrane protein [Crocinitomicaceae bacterium]